MVKVTLRDDQGRNVDFIGYETDQLRRVAIGIVIDGHESIVNLTPNEVKALRHMLPRK
jgi:hypothetical protein